MIGVIAARDLRSAFVSPLAWTVLAVVQFLAAFMFLERLDRLRLVLPQLLAIDGAPGVTDLVAVPVFGAVSGLLLLVVPLLTMGAVAGEHRRGTMLLLRSSPVSATAIVVGKWLAVVALLGVVVASVALMPLSLALGTTLDWGKLAAAALGVMLLVATFAAAGVWVSTVARQPVVAAAAAVGLLLVLWFLGGVAPAVAPLTRLEPLLAGAVDSGDVAYFVLATLWFLALAIRRLDAETAPRGWRLRAQGLAFIALFTAAVGVAGVLADRHAVEADWTHGDRNTLAPASVALVEALDAPVTVTAFVRDDDVVRRHVDALFARYRRAGAEVALEYVNPDLEPERTREAGISHDAELVLGYHDGTEHVSTFDERAVSTALQRLVRGADRIVAFVVGHGERDPLGEANHDLGTFGAELARQGIRARPLNPVLAGGIPAGTDALVVTQPRAQLLAGAAELVAGYVAAGGNLLWFADPGGDAGLAPLAAALGVTLGGAPVEDAASGLFGIDDPRLVVVADYGDHPATRSLDVVTLLPQVVSVAAGGGGWRATPLLRTVGGETLAVALERGEQRAAVVGDGDFVSNTYLNNGGNLELGLNLVNWVVGDDAQLDITLRSAPDLTLDLTRNEYYAIAFTFLLGLPFAYAVAGTTIRWRRRRR